MSIFMLAVDTTQHTLLLLLIACRKGPYRPPSACMKGP